MSDHGSLHPLLSTVLVGFDGTRLPDGVSRLLSQGLGGVVLFARNITDREQVMVLCAAVRSAARGMPAPIIAVDQEGGRVQRLRGLVPDVPPMAEIGVKGPVAAEETGTGMGACLRELGFNTDFAPVLDVNTNPDNPIIGDRAFSSDAVVVGQCGAALVRGMHRAGVTACGKHFPGHGDTSLDSHEDLPIVDTKMTTLSRRELSPFSKAVEAGLKMVMTSHCLYTEVDTEHPATLSAPVVNGLLRDGIGFKGVVVTDDLGMKAVSERYSFEEMLSRGFAIGVDLFMHCGADGQGEELARKLNEMSGAGALDETLVRRSARRVMELRKTLH